MKVPRGPDDPMRDLDRFEVAMRNLIAVQDLAVEAVKQLQDRAPEEAADFLGELMNCHPGHLLEMVVAFKGRVEG